MSTDNGILDKIFLYIENINNKIIFAVLPPLITHN